MRAAQSVVQFGLRRHPCTKDRQEQKQQTHGGSADALEKLQQQHRNRRQSRTIKETKSGSWQSRTKKKYRKEALDASEAKARIAAARAELEQTNTKYCGDDCCPIVECPDRWVLFCVWLFLWSETCCGSQRLFCCEGVSAVCALFLLCA